MKPMKQFTYREYDITTGIVFTNLSIDIKQKFKMDIYNDPKVKPVFEALADYIGNNIEILEEEK